MPTVVRACLPITSPKTSTIERKTVHQSPVIAKSVSRVDHHKNLDDAFDTTSLPAFGQDDQANLKGQQV